MPAQVIVWLAFLRRGKSFILDANPYQDVRVYTSRPDLLVEYPDRILIPRGERIVAREPVSLIATVRNEAATIELWLDSIRRQTRRPDEIVITDGGSTDDTVEKILAFEEKHRLGIRLIQEAGANVARGRNIAIKAAKYEIIAITDAGCELSPDWLHLLTIPFSLCPETEVAAGFYEARTRSLFERIVTKFTVPTLQSVDPRTFNPSSRSLALRKSFFEKIGGYPEYLTLSGEDTLLDVTARMYARHWAFVPEAIVYWHVPSAFRKLRRTFFSWGRGDGEAGLHSPIYVTLALVYGAALALLLVAVILAPFIWPASVALLFVAVLLWGAVLRKYNVWNIARESDYNLPLVIMVLATIHFGQVTGFLRGWLNRGKVKKRKLAGVTRNFLVLAGIPMYDTGGGQRSTQLTLELLRRGFKVTYVNYFPSYETRLVRFHYPNPLLESRSIATFRLRQYRREHEASLSRTCVLIEFPLGKYLKIAKKLQARGARLIYDLMDDWSSALGSGWYSKEVEDEIIAISDYLVATAQDLKNQLERRAPGRSVLLLPNAVNTELFDPNRFYPRPADLPDRRPIIGYIGSMYGEWFREDLVIKVAQSYPDASIVVIGDHKQRFARKPENLYTLGLKPHMQIPAYLAHFDVCLIPFKQMELVQATSPIKVFEYLAMGKPVVATTMKELQGIPNVYLSDSDEEFIANVARALSSKPDRTELQSFIDNNSWRARIDALLRLIDERGRRV